MHKDEDDLAKEAEKEEEDSSLRLAVERIKERLAESRNAEDRILEALFGAFRPKQDDEGEDVAPV